MAAQIKEWSKEEADNKRAVDIASKVVSVLDENQFAILRSLAHVRADTAAERERRERRTRSTLQKMRNAAWAWDGIWEPKKAGESENAALDRLTARRNEFRSLLWSATFNPNLIWVETLVPVPRAIIGLKESHIDPMKRHALCELCRALGQSTQDEIALGFAVLVHLGMLGDKDTRAYLEMIAKELSVEALFADIVRVLETTHRRADRSDETAQVVIRLTASWA